MRVCVRVCVCVCVCARVCIHAALASSIIAHGGERERGAAWHYVVWQQAWVWGIWRLHLARVRIIN